MKHPFPGRLSNRNVCLSTMEDEYISLTEVVKELIWLKNVLKNGVLNLNLKDCTLFSDNQAAIAFCKFLF